MACFLVPMVLAIMTSIIQKTARNLAEKIKLGLLNTLLWGGVTLLALEHLWHGEVVPWPPYLTAMVNPADIPVMLHEMAVVGTAMSVVTVCAWISVVTITTFVMPKIIALKEMKGVKKPATPT